MCIMGYNTATTMNKPLLQMTTWMTITNIMVTEEVSLEYLLQYILYDFIYTKFKTSMVLGVRIVIMSRRVERGIREFLR